MHSSEGESCLYLLSRGLLCLDGLGVAGTPLDGVYESDSLSNDGVESVDKDRNDRGVPSS